MMKILLACSLLWVGGLCQEFAPTATVFTTPLAGARLTALVDSCQSLVEDCKPTEASCASQLCKSCTNLGIKPTIDPCCRAQEPHQCFAGKSPTPLFTTSVDTSVLACKSLVAVSSSCAKSTKGFYDMGFGAQADCACYLDGEPQPQVYDAFYKTCFAWLKTKNPGQFSMFGPTGGRDAIMTPCEDYMASPAKYATMTAPPTAAATEATGSSETGTAKAQTTSQGSGASSSSQPDRLIMIAMASIAFVYSLVA